MVPCGLPNIRSLCITLIWACYAENTQLFVRSFNQKIIFTATPILNILSNRHTFMSTASPLLDFRIVVPVFNESRVLEVILTRINKLGYLDKISFVNDASTDSTKNILDKWVENYGIEVLNLKKNMKKEGAIREVLERMARSKKLPQYIFILDADSFIDTSNRSIDRLFVHGREYMLDNDLVGLAVRIDAFIGYNSNPLQKCVYVDYAAVQSDNWITAKQWQLWLINGPGGLFRAEELLESLRAMTPDFETGDLQISVNLMKRGLRIGFFPHITVRTAVPDTISEYFNQRRRWERGTIKVLWNDRHFYFSVFRKFRILALLTVIHLSIYAGISYLVFVALLFHDASATIMVQIISVGIFWYFINLAKLFFNPYVRKSRFILKIPMWAAWNGVIWLFVTSPARILGCTDAVLHLLKNRKRIHLTSTNKTAHCYPQKVRGAQ